MKKFTFLVAALCATMMASAATVTFGSEDLSVKAMSKSGITVTPAQEDGQNAPVIKINTYDDINTLRVYAKGSLTFDAGSAKISSITLKLNSATNAKRLTTMTSSVGEVNVVGDPDWTATWTNEGVSNVKFTVGDIATLGSENTKAGQIHIMEIIVVTEGEGGSEGGEEGGGSEGGEGELDYSFEPTEVTTIDETMLKADWTDYTDDGWVLVWLSNEEYEVSLAVITTEAAMPVGTFKINDSAEENTVLASPGGDETDDYPSFVAADFEGDVYNAAYYLVSGNVTISVAEDVYTIKLDAKSYNGSTIKMTYTGAVEEYTAIRTVEIDNTVYARDGRIYAEEGARIYSLTGLDVTRMNGNLEGIYIVKNGNKVAKVAVAK